MMFTNIALHQQPHHFSHSLQQANQDHYRDPLFVSPLSTVAHQSAVRHGPSQQRLQKPQQYAHPLSRSVSLSRSHSRQDLSFNESTPKPEGSEYMLRRKTPNGTLAAGYDGRPVEWTARPHAIKHILMPMSHTMGEPKYQPRLPDWAGDQSPSVVVQNLASRDPVQRQLLGHGGTLENSGSDSEITVIDRRHSGHPAIGLDSVLNQGSILHQYGNMAGDQPTPTVLQPMWPPCMGLTSMNTPGLYGPYWPDGAFIPYRPAPLRDPRYPNQLREDPALRSSYLHALSNTQEDWNNTLNQPGFRYDQSHQASKYAGNVEISNHYPATQIEDQNLRFQYSPDRRILQQHHNPLVHRGKPDLSRSLSDMSDATWGSTRISGSTQPIITQPEFQNSSVQANHVFKDKVLMWAHRVYESLLFSMNHSYRNGYHHGDRQLQSAVYPKAPRQSCLNLSGNHRSISRTQENPQVRIGVPAEGLRTPPEQEERWQPSHLSYSHLANDRSNLKQSIRNSAPHRLSRNCSLKWQANDQHHSMQYSGSHIQPLPTAPSTQYQSNLSPSTAATSALEMLERLCEESGWQWIDGMLLGGCLAYGLGNYSKAMDWYRKVLSCDPK